MPFVFSIFSKFTLDSRSSSSVLLERLHVFYCPCVGYEVFVLFVYGFWVIFCGLDCDDVLFQFLGFVRMRGK